MNYCFDDISNQNLKKEGIQFNKVLKTAIFLWINKGPNIKIVLRY